MYKDRIQNLGAVFHTFIRDARNFQILFLSCFLLYGVLFLQWTPNILNWALVISSCLLVQLIGILLFNLPKHSWRSALITSLGLCLLFKAGEPAYFVLAGALAIGSKFLIRFRGKHIFNPANFGIIVPILLTGQTWISPGQWGSSSVLLLFFGAAGLMILLRISRLETGLTFLAAYFVLLVGRDILYLGWNWELVAHKLTNGALLLFAFFMITDPMTIPNNKRVRILWALGLAILSFWISTNWSYHTAAMWVLFIGSPIVPILDKYFPADKYVWRQTITGSIKS